ncbi:MAG: 16S rRNA processing protein RimM [Bacilli bacterium]|nr:16S rRNA processing protein RimM [Bacilli bacterium]
MKFIKIGKIVNTHGIKGELRILSDFRHKDKVFVKNMKVYVGKKKQEFIINSYRFHKIFDMVTFNGFNNINDVEYLKGDFVYINEDDLNLDGGEIYSEKLIGFKAVIGKTQVGTVTEILDTPANEVIRVNENILIPYVKEFINKIDMENNTIYINDIGGLV